MNILYHHRTRATGAEGVHIRGTQKAFVDLGHNVFDISLVKPRSYPEDVNHASPPNQTSNFLSRFGKFLDYIPEWLFDALGVLYNLRSRTTLYKFEPSKVDLIYERYAYFSFATISWGKKYGIPTILEVNTTTLQEDVRKIALLSVARAIEKYVLKNADLLVVVSTFLKGCIINFYGIPEQKILVCPNAVDPSWYEIDEKAFQIFLSYLDPSIKAAFVQGRPIIGFVGVFVRWHGLDLLVENFAKLLKVSSFFKKPFLLLVGDGPMRDKLENIANRLDVDNDIAITGFVPHDKVKYYISLFDIAVMPESNEFGSPMKIFEYMVLGKPVIAAGYGPIAEVIEDGFNGLLFSPGDSDRFIELLEILLSDRKYREILSKNAQVRVLQRHTWKKNVEKILKKLAN